LINADHAPRTCVDIVWHVHVLRMFTFREQEELMNNTSTYISWWNIVWHLPINIVGGTTGDQFFNKVLTKIFVGMI
jgi:hypothetical protein